MITLRPIAPADAPLLDCLTTYCAMTAQERAAMIAESQAHLHNGRYFEILVVLSDSEPVGLMNLYAHSAHIISCGPEIRPDCRRRGFAFEGERQALEYARRLGYTIAIADVHEHNAASIALHESLGFELERTITRPSGREMRLYLRSL